RLENVNEVSIFDISSYTCYTTKKGFFSSRAGKRPYRFWNSTSIPHADKVYSTAIFTAWN
ncbi:MAG: hypothetical protein ACNYWM_13350, partial [Methanosarcinales archaeon]